MKVKSKTTVVSYVARSDKGSVRSANEDNLYCNGVFIRKELLDEPFSHQGQSDSACALAVCDGMGGHQYGEFASGTAVECLRNYINLSSEQIDDTVMRYISDVNTRICEKMKTESIRTGTTIALVIIVENTIHAYNIGDSRIYIMKSGQLSRLSEDHTVVAQKIKMGILTESQAHSDKDFHKLTRCIGVFEDEMEAVPFIANSVVIDKSCRVLICSDGLTDMVNDADIGSILRKAKTSSDAADALMNLAMGRGGEDNITCIVADAQKIGFIGSLKRLFRNS